MSERIDFTELYHQLRTFGKQELITLEKRQYVRRSYLVLHGELEGIIERLKAAGVTAGSRIGILAENRYEWLLFDWAIAALDCVSVVFLEDDAQRGAQALMDTYELCLIVTTKKHAALAEGRDDGVMLMDGPNPTECVRYMPADSLRKRDDEFSNCFSTGTAGVSKGLVVSEQGIARVVTDCLDLYGLGEGDRIVVFMPLTAFQQRLFTYAALLKGLSIVLAKPIQLFRMLKECSPTILVGPPSLFESVHEQALRGETSLPEDQKEQVAAHLRQQMGAKMKVMLCGMAKTSPATISFFRDLGLPLYEVYGLSETGLVGTNTPENYRLGSVGKPFVGTDVRISDEGEVLVRKPCFMSQGYFQGYGTLREPAYFGEWFATGDLGSLDKDGFLTLTGRKDNMFVAASGHNILPEPLEMKLESLPEIKTAVVFGHTDSPCLSTVLVLSDEPTPELKEQVLKGIDDYNDEVEKWCEIGNVIFADEPFSPENGLRNRGLKLNRKAIYAQYKESIEAGLTS